MRGASVYMYVYMLLRNHSSHRCRPSLISPYYRINRFLKTTGKKKRSEKLYNPLKLPTLFVAYIFVYWRLRRGGGVRIKTSLKIWFIIQSLTNSPINILFLYRPHAPTYMYINGWRTRRHEANSRWFFSSLYFLYIQPACFPYGHLRSFVCLRVFARCRKRAREPNLYTAHLLAASIMVWSWRWRRRRRQTRWIIWSEHRRFCAWKSYLVGKTHTACMHIGLDANKIENFTQPLPSPLPRCTNVAKWAMTSDLRSNL